MSAPFYTSERISSPHPKWKEIDSGIAFATNFTFKKFSQYWINFTTLGDDVYDGHGHDGKKVHCP